MTPYLGEFVGTLLLVLLGNGINANVTLKNTYGHGAGWVATALGWGMAVFVGVYAAAPFSGGHINPAVTLGLAAAGKFSWQLVPGYVLAQLAGGFSGAALTYLHYRPHFAATTDASAKLGIFCTGPAIRGTFGNLISEIIGTFVLILGVLFLVGGDGLGSLDALPAALLVVGIGFSLGGTTGYAINPARDLGPRLFHQVAPIRGKRDSDWGYGWIPVAGPCIGALVAAGSYLLLFS